MPGAVTVGAQCTPWCPAMCPVSATDGAGHRTLARDPAETIRALSQLCAFLRAGTPPAKELRMNIAQLKRLPSVLDKAEAMRSTSAQDTQLATESVRWYRKR